MARIPKTMLMTQMISQGRVWPPPSLPFVAAEQDHNENVTDEENDVENDVENDNGYYPKTLFQIELKMRITLPNFS